MRVLHLIPYMHPSAGGPPVVADQWCAGLPEVGVDAEILTTDAYADAESDDSWLREYRDRYPVQVLPHRGPKGFGFSPAMRPAFLAALKRVDIVHLHNLWGYTNQIAARYCTKHGVPFVVSPHGMLDPNSVSRKWLKKRVYGSLFEFPALRKAAGLIFTHSEEDRLARTECKDLPQG
jgi:glycosyltransferase involved in cell wall biosynthesis